MPLGKYLVEQAGISFGRELMIFLARRLRCIAFLSLADGIMSIYVTGPSQPYRRIGIPPVSITLADVEAAAEPVPSAPGCVSRSLSVDKRSRED